MTKGACPLFFKGNNMEEKLTAREEREIQTYLDLKDKVCDLLEGQNIKLIIPLLTGLLAEISVANEIDLEEIIAATASTIRQCYEEELPNKNSLLH